MIRKDWSVEKSIEDFKERAEEMGIDISMKPTGEENRYNIELDSIRTNHTKDSYALLGLAHHFINRKWAKDITYMYIVKDKIHLTFTNETD